MEAPFPTQGRLSTPVGQHARFRGKAEVKQTYCPVDRIDTIPQTDDTAKLSCVIRRNLTCVARRVGSIQLSHRDFVVGSREIATAKRNRGLEHQNEAVLGSIATLTDLMGVSELEYRSAGNLSEFVQ